MRILFVLLTVSSLRLSVAYPTTHDDEPHDDIDGETSRKIIGQSVVTSVSVIMNGDGEAPQFTDAVGKTVPRPLIHPQLASPINLLNPDRYEFYTFDDNGELVKRLMTLKEIQSIVANGNGAMIGDNEPESQSVILNTIPLSSHGAETKVQDIVDNVQNVLSREMENNKNISQIPAQLLDTPDVSSSWSMILPAIFGNTGDEILPHKPINMTPETEIVDTTTWKVVPTRKTTTTTEAAAPTTKAQTQSSAVPTSSTKQQTIVMSTKKQTVKPKPSTIRTTPRTTTIQTTTEPITEELPKTTTRPSTVKVTATKKSTKKPVRPLRPLTNSPIVIEKIAKRPPLHVESKTDGVQSKTERVTQTPTTLEMNSDAKKRPSSSSFKTTLVAKTEAPTTTSHHQTSTVKPRPPTMSTTVKVVPYASLIMDQAMDQTTLSVSEEDRQDSAINQIIGSLQSDLFKNYERITTIDPPSEETTAGEQPMEKIGDLNLAPDKVLLNDQLFIDEAEPIVKNLPTTATPEEPTTTNSPSFERLEATTVKAKEAISLANSEVMQTIEKLIQEQVNEKTNKAPEKLDVLGFDDDDETEIKLNETLDSKNNLTQSAFITKAATIASILSSKFVEPSTTTVEPSDESDTTVPTILSEALSNVIQLMIEEQEAKKTTERPKSDEPSESDLTKLLHHYEDLNSHRDQLEALSMLSESFLTTQAAEPEVTTVADEQMSFETKVVKETSSVSMKIDDDSLKSKPEATTIEDKIAMTTTDASTQEFSTFFLINSDEIDSTLDPLHDGLGDFTTEQFVETEKKFSDRKEEFFTTPSSIESDEESSEIVADVLNVIGIASDEEDEESIEKRKHLAESQSQESDEVESAILRLTSTIDKTLTTDVDTDFKLTSKIASSLISVADSISETLGGDEDSDETFAPTTFAPALKTQEIVKAQTTEKTQTTEKAEATEKAQEIVKAQTTEKAPEIEKVSAAEKSEIVQKIEEIKKSPEETETNSSVRDEPTTIEPAENYSTESDEATEKMMSSEELSTEMELVPTTEHEVVNRKQEKDGSSPMVQLSVIRKDSSLEEIEYITPPTPTSTKLPTTEGIFIKINSIETTSTPKMSGFKNKSEEIVDNIRPIYVALRGTTTAKSSGAPEVSPSQATSVEQTSKVNAPLMTERVPLIEVTRASEKPQFLSSTEDNLVEVKIQTKLPATTEDHVTTFAQLQSNSQTIKNSIKNSQHQPRPQSPPIDLSAAPEEALGLAASTAHLNTDLKDFAKLCNDLAFSFWKSITADGISQARSVIISPFSLTSTLSMIFLGARGQTSGEMNDLLRLDDMVSFNPHVIFRNISESIEQSRKSGIAAAAFVRELYSDRSKGKLLPYFKEKAQQFYGAHVEEVSFSTINDIIRRRTNLLVKRHTYNKINEFLKTSNIWLNEPLAAFAANVFLTDCSGATMSDRDGEMFFQVSPAIRQRRLIPIPAAVYRSGFTAGYDPILDATAVAFGDELQSTIMVMPGQQGSSIPGDNLERLESAFMDTSNDAWGRLLTTFMERPGLEVQIPRFSHRSLINTTFALQQMGLKDIFSANKADLRGLTGAKSNDLFFSDLMQINQFSTCGEDKIGDSHHIEIYPSPSLKRDINDDDEEEDNGKLEIESPDTTNMQYKTMFYDPIYDSRYINVPLPLRPRQARLPENPRLRFDRPFLYFVRHNPTGIILFMGRFNPRLLP